MTRRHPVWSGFVTLALVVAACSSDGFDAGVEGEEVAAEETAEPTATAEPSPTATPAVERVQILSGTVTELGDRRDLTFTVDDVGDIAMGTVPDVVGLLVDEAVDALMTAGFAVYRVETFPPTDDMDRVVDMWPPPGLDFASGVNVFLELDGPLDAVPVEVGAALTGITNGRQLLAFDRFENWLLRAWLDDPVAVEVPGDALTVGREVELSVPVDDIVCTTREIVSDPTILPPGSPITFTLAEDPADTVRFRAPERISAADVIVDCG